jgi:molybdopterin-binding protein
MKLSARNQLKGKIVAVTKGQTTAHVRIDIGGGVIVTSSITNEAVDDLALTVGDDAFAVIKASDVMVGGVRRRMFSAGASAIAGLAFAPLFAEAKPFTDSVAARVNVPTRCAGVPAGPPASVTLFTVAPERDAVGLGGPAPGAILSAGAIC